MEDASKALEAKAFWAQVSKHAEELAVEAVDRMFAEHPASKDQFPHLDLHPGSKDTRALGQQVAAAMRSVAMARLDTPAPAAKTSPDAQKLFADPGNVQDVLQSLQVTMGTFLQCQIDSRMTDETLISLDRFLELVALDLASQNK